MVSYLQANVGAFGSNVAEILGWLTDGEITLAEFGGLIIAALAVPEFLAVLAAVGATATAVFPIVLYVKCQSGG